MSNENFNTLYAPPCYIDDNGNLIGVNDNGANDQKIVNWVEENLDRSQNFLRSQRGWKSADICMSILHGDESGRIASSKFSTVTVKKLRRQGREAIANASNIRPRWKTKTFKNAFQETKEIYNKLRDGWFYSLFVDRFIKESLQYGGGAGTGYLMLWPEWNNSTNQIEIMPKVLSHKNVFPFHAGVDARIENVYGISAYFEMPLPEAHRKFPEHIGIIKADRDIPSYFASRYEKAKKSYGTGIMGWIGRKNQNENFTPYPVADIFYTWVMDDSINKSGMTLIIGDPETHYSYKVPALFDKFGKICRTNGNKKTITSDDPRYNEKKEGGSFKYRKLSRKECKLFPYRRLIISTRNGVIYDGPPMWICRRPPITQFVFERMVGEWLGISLLRDGRSLERSANNMARAIEDGVVGRLNPPIAINSSLGQPIIGKLTGSVRSMIGKVFKTTALVAEKALIPLLPADYFNIDARAVELIKFLHEMSDYVMGTADYAAWQRLKQLPAADTQEQMTENLGVLATDQEREVERSLLEVGEIWQDFAPQVYTTDRVITTLGADGITEETWDFDYTSLVQKTETDLNLSYAERLQNHLKKFSLYASPHSMQERQSITNKLTKMQLRKVGVPISDRNLYETFMDDGEFERNRKEYNEEQEEKILQAAKLQKKLAEANQEADPQNQLHDELLNQIRGQGGNEGRPNNNATPPRLESKTRNGVPGDPTLATS